MTSSSNYQLQWHTVHSWKVNLEDLTLYHNMIGVFQYYNLTCPDICFIENKVYQFMHNQTNVKFASMKKILVYLKDTISYGISIEVLLSIPWHVIQMLIKSHVLMIRGILVATPHWLVQAWYLRAPLNRKWFLIQV